MAKKTTTKKQKAAVEQAECAPVRESKPAADGQFPIIGIGGAEGGFEALSVIVPSLAADTGMAFVCVQHVDPKLVGELTELLQRQAKIPVVAARDQMVVERDRIYVVPRDTSIALVDGRLTLGSRNIIAGELTSIDTFFRSLAMDRGPRAIGVLLSGSGADGPLGLKAIKAAGGITLVQDPKTARFESMPRAAIASGSVDFIRSPENIGQELALIGRIPPIDESGAEADGTSLPGSPEIVGRILTAVRSHTGVDFANYKTSTVKRRILRRMVLRHLPSPEKYLEILRSDPAEVRALYEDILINVTEFFRDPEVFSMLREQVFPRILERHQNNGNRNLRLWIPGCATGEEVYSLAIVLLEFLADRVNDYSIQMFGTDISETALERARNGIYPPGIAQNVSPDRLRRFFVKSDAGYQIHKRVREMCIFASHNVTKDPPFSRLDLISCRNVLIYLGSVLQDRLMPVLHYALNPDGFLVLGSSESVGVHGDLFLPVDKKNKIYIRRSAPVRLPFDFSMEPMRASQTDAHRKPEIWSELDVQREADRIVLNKFGPPGVVIDEDDNIVQFRGQTSQFLEPTSGAASLNLMRMLKEGLAVSVKKALADARKRNAPIRRQGIPLASDGHSLINLDVIPLRQDVHTYRRFLVLFENYSLAPPPIKTGKGSQRMEFLQTENAHLRQELASTKECLQAIIEDQEAAQEELRSAAEEIQSSNEELQSTNEELETAKEELQSSNEELNTVNEELQTRNLQLMIVGNDLLNLLANVNIAVLILGNDLRIRRFTPMAEKTLNLIPSDTGRPLRDLNLRIRIPDLEALLTDVLENLTPKSIEVTDSDGRRFSLRVRPYRTEDHKIDGIVMVFIDIDPVGRDSEAHLELRAAAQMSDQIEKTPSAIALLSAQENERKRLSRRLHDEFNQQLALLELTVQDVENKVSSEELRRQLVEVRRRVAEVSEDLRRVAYQLHPAILDDLGLVPALQQACDDYGREGLQVQFTHRDVPGNVPGNVRLAVYRVAQESLRNVAKHSGAKRATVSLTGQRDRIELAVRDSGIGFDLDALPHKGLGMVGMKERTQLLGGSIEFKSKPGEGTTVFATIPLNAEFRG